MNRRHRYTSAIASGFVLISGAFLVATSLAGDASGNDPASADKLGITPLPYTRTPPVPLDVTVPVGQALARAGANGETRAAIEAFGRSDVSAIMSSWRRQKAYCIKDSPNGRQRPDLCAGKAGAAGEQFVVDTVEIIANGRMDPEKARALLQSWLDSNPGRVVFVAASGSQVFVGVALTEARVDPRSKPGEEPYVVSHLWLDFDQSGGAPLLRLQPVTSPLRFWREANRPVSELILVAPSLVDREAREDRELAEAIRQVAVAEATAAAATAGVR